MSEASIPKEWSDCQVGMIADVIAGGTPKAGNPDNFAEPGSGIAWLTPADLSGYKQKFISHGARDLSQAGYDSSSAKLMPKGSILFSSRAPIGYVAVAANEISTNQGFKNFVLPNGVDSSYAYFYFRSIRDLAESLGTGTTFKEISGATAKTLPFVLPPLAEQKEIATRLDDLLAQVDSVKTRLDGLPAILKRFRQSVLAAAVSGKLTEEWRKENKVAFDWNPFLIEDLACEKKYSLGIGPFGSNLKVTDYRDHGHPLVFVREIRAHSFGGEGTKFVSTSKFNELKAHRVEPGNILITKMGDPPGDVAIYPLDRPKAVITADCIKLSVDESKATTNFVYYSMMSECFRAKVFDISGGVAQQKVNLKKFKKLNLDIPSLPEQAEIVRRVEELFAFADQVDLRVTEAQGHVNHLTQSILAKAFRGELTEQWRKENSDLITGENSATALLERIKSERANQKPKNKTRKKKA
ncbi:restriction endonuclease subunit S [Tichowtungia aerotolerans]|uniref:Restriction endonuclease subunit S n=1 Tax=Tichowtungia aerotolerans TaxID=2697043 RepID=A0A6P1M783_9BACT|nr:restriction endonuclease subunit S [Tichowtungia aerotolerans]QHI68893.1 restriction endonuclease subunit S [Tichowtungia aerotolerans]